MFFGTPAWAVPSLDALAGSAAEVAAVVTNPDRPVGRRREVRASPVKEAAGRLGIPVLQPPRARDPELEAVLTDLRPDVAVVVAYGKILPGSLLQVPSKGFVNLHFSLLPAYRGAAPVQHALIQGESVTGVSVMVLTEGMDEGPVLGTLEAPIDDDDTAGSLGGRLAVAGAPFLVETLERYVAGDLEPRPQDDAAATYAPKISDDDARIDWRRSAAEIRNLVRGLNPEPGAWTTLRGERLKVHRATLAAAGEAVAPGTLEVRRRDLLCGTDDVALVLDEVQAAGRTRMSGAELARGLRLESGEVVG